MGKARIALGVMSFALLGAVLGYVLASTFLTFRWFGVGADIDFLMLARSYVKWSQKFGQSAKVCPKPLKGYENGEAPKFYRSV